MRHAAAIVVLTAIGACMPAADLTPREWDALAQMSIEGAVPSSVGTDEAGDRNQVAYRRDAQLLGRLMYFDTGLSSDGLVSCNTCHDVGTRGADPRGEATSVGAGGKVSPRNAPTLYNAVYRQAFGWFGEEKVLWRQNVRPLKGQFHNMAPDELAEVVCDKYDSDDFEKENGFRYRDIFGECDPRSGSPLGLCAPLDDSGREGEGGLVCENTAKALGAYVRTLKSADSPFDRFIGSGVFEDRDTDAIPADALRGARLFVGRASCDECHRGPTLSTHARYSLGVGSQEVDEAGNPRRYQTPPLRDVAGTAPYMHDGSYELLWDVLEFYRAGGDAARGHPVELAPLRLSHDDMLDIEAFLGQLDGAPLDYCWVHDDDECCDASADAIEPPPEGCPGHDDDDDRDGE